MNDIIAIFSDLNVFSYKRELLFRYLSTLNEDISYLVVTNKKYGRISKHYQGSKSIVSLGYVSEIDKKYIKHHIDEIAYFISCYNVEKIFYVDNELDFLRKHFLVQKIDESYVNDIVRFNKKDIVYCEKSLIIDFTYRENLTSKEFDIINNLAAYFKVNVFVRSKEKKKYSIYLKKEVKLIYKKDYFDPYYLNFDFGFIFSKEDCLSYLDFSSNGIVTISLDSTFSKVIKVSKSNYIAKIQEIFSSVENLLKIKNTYFEQ